MSVPRTHRTGPFGHVRVLQEAAEKKGAKVLFRTRVTELVTDKDKRVTGVCAESKGQSLRVRARKGVLLATGGFGHDTERMKAVDPRLAGLKVVVGARHAYERVQPQSLRACCVKLNCYRSPPR